MSQTGLIGAVTESAHIPKGRLKNTPTPATSTLHADTEVLNSRSPNRARAHTHRHVRAL
jgi:hypothetical protein